MALKSFKGEIKVLRGSIHQLSMERDQLRTSLNRTADENKRLVRDGDEQSDQIARSTEMKLRSAVGVLHVDLHVQCSPRNSKLEILGKESF